MFKQIAQLKQHSLKKLLVTYLKKHYPKDKVFYSEHYIYAIGDIPIALVAHMDTVHTKIPSQIFWDRQQDVVWSPQGLGADDRAGVFAIMSIIGSGLRPHIVFTTDEEKGGIGASLLSKRTNPFKDLRYMIELDRNGFKDCVFYDCNNKKFKDFVENFGFETDWGTYSDICELCPAWGVAGVNLSIGYFHEHTISEYLMPHILFETIAKVKRMLTAENIKKFKYIPYINKYKDKYFERYYNNYAYAYGYDDFSIICSECKEVFFEDEVFPVKGLDGLTKYYCPDCVSREELVGWCVRCNEPFEKENSKDDNIFCQDCKKQIKEAPTA